MRRTFTEDIVFMFTVERITSSLTMTNKFLAPALSLALFLSFALGLQAACVPPPTVQRKGHGFDIINYQGIWDCKAADAAMPRSEAELIHAVAHAVKKKQKIKMVSTLLHSMHKLVCPGSEGLIISTQNYASVIEINKTAMTITVQAGTMMRDVLEEAAKEGLALPNMIYWNGVSAAGVVSTGSHGTGLAGRGGGVYEYVVGMRLVVPAPAGEGYAKVITLTEEDEELKAARLSLGTLGAISEITFVLEPMFKRSLSFSLRNDMELEKEAEQFLRDHEFADMLWTPSHGRAVFRAIDRVSVDVPGDAHSTFIGAPTTVASIETSAYQYNIMQAEEDLKGLCNLLDQQTVALVVNGSGFLNDGKQFTGYPVVGFNNRLQASGGCQGADPAQEDNLAVCTPTKVLDKNETVCSWDHRVHTSFYFDVGLRVPVSRLQEAVEDVKKIRDLNPSRVCDTNGISIRSIRKSEAYLGPPEDVVSLELIYYRPREAGPPKWNADVWQEIEQMVIEKHGGFLHWGKSGGYLFEGLAKTRTVSLEKFLEVKDRFDPDKIFSNDWTDGLFGIGGKRVEVLRKWCALDQRCKCREDKHCAPDKGFFCESGLIWKNARVCRKRTPLANSTI